jgi:hypothetical protein
MQEDQQTPPSGKLIVHDAPAIAQEGKVRLQVSTVSKLNLADFQNAVPALRELAVVNGTAAAIDELTISLTAEPAFIKPRAWILDSVGAKQTFHVTALDVQLDGALLSRLTEAEIATLTFELRSRKQPGEVLARHHQTVELLARNQWGGITHLPEMVAAFVQPNDSAIDRLLKAAAVALQAAGKSGSIDGYTTARRGRGNWPRASGPQCCRGS